MNDVKYSTVQTVSINDGARGVQRDAADIAAMRMRRASQHGFTHAMRLLPILLVASVLARSEEKHHAQFVDEFIRTLRGLAGRAVVLDIGTNSGTWSAWVMAAAQRRMATQTPLGVDLVMFEPQPQFAERLAALATQWNGTHVAAAAWTADTTLTFLMSSNSEASSLVKSIASLGHREEPKELKVRAVDLARFFRDERAVRDASLVLCKIDIEAAEFDVLPHLLARGALCSIDYLIIEWHLNALPSERRLAGLGLRLSIADTLRHGCPPRPGRSPPRVQHADDPSNNLYVEVPGLREELQRHELPQDNSSSRRSKAAMRVASKWSTSHARGQS